MADEVNLFEGIGEEQPTAPAPVTQGAPQAAVAPPVATPGAPQPQAPGAAPQEATGAPTAEATDPFANSASLADTGEALGVGVAKGIFATKDFFATGAGLWGETPKEADRSSLRQWVDSTDAAGSAKWGLGYDMTSGLAQGAVGLLGVGKLQALGTAANLAITTVRTTAAFEAHSANIANLVEKIPGMNGPITDFFASSPNDSAATGYLKNALLSLGVEGAAVGLFTGTAAALRAWRGGDQSAIDGAHAELEKALGEHVQGLQSSTTGGEPSATLETASGPSTSSSSASPPGTEGLTSSKVDSTGSGSPTQTPLGSSPSSSPGELGSSSSLAPTPQGSDVRAVSSPTQGAEAIGTTLPPRTSLPDIDDEALGKIVASAASDQAALLKHGSWDAALAAGYRFGGEEKIPWQVIGGQADSPNAETALDAFTARVRDTLAAHYEAVKGGEVVSDAANVQSVSQMASLWNVDPSAFIGTLQQAGKQAIQLRATMEAGFLVGGRALQDAYTMASRINMGELSEWGGDVNQALAALRGQAQVGAASMGNAMSIMSNSARAMRGLRSEFRLDPMSIRNLQSADGQGLVDLLMSTKGDPASLNKAVSMASKISEGLQLSLVNGLISNPLTHAIIYGSNLWQIMSRPAQRAIGSVANGSMNTVGVAAVKQYYYMATSIRDSFNQAVAAFKAGDSIIAPHDLGAVTGGMESGGAPTTSGLGQQIAQAQYGPVNSPTDLLRNGLLAAAKIVTFPTRSVGFQDELVKQVVYRGYVQARAVVEGTQQGLADADLTRFVKGKLLNSFDDYGRATDGAALNEAKTSTYQNDLQDKGWWPTPTPLGTVLQRGMNQDFPLGRVIIPFVRTPVNLFRQGVQLTPGLNLLQREYGMALAGANGAEKQAQAMGQMAVGGLLMGTMGTLAYQGYVTGDAPSDKRAAATLMATGWRPNSIVSVNKDGTKTYTPYSRWDPIMMPMAWAANAVSILTSDQPADQNKAHGMLAAMAIGIMKQLTDKMYLQNLKSTIDAIDDPDRSFARVAGSLAGNYVPFSSLLHLINPDPIMREADTFMSAALAKVPGFSKDYPPRYDWAGDPVSVHKGLWVDTPGDRADAEVQRMALEQGTAIGVPSSRARGEADLRNITLAGNQDTAAAGQNAYSRFQELAGHPERATGGDPSAEPLKTAVEKLIAMPEYKGLPDGDAGTKDTKAWALTELIHGYRDTAKRYLGADINVRSAEYSEAMRVAAAAGHLTPASPTPTNATDGLLKRLGSYMGVGGLGAPAPATPTTALPGGVTGQ